MPCHRSPSSEAGWMKSSLVTVQDPCAEQAGFQYVTLEPLHGCSPALGRPPDLHPCRSQRPVVRKQLCGASLTYRSATAPKARASWRLRGSACGSGLRPPHRGGPWASLCQCHGRPQSKRSAARAFVCSDSRPLKLSVAFRVEAGGEKPRSLTWEGLCHLQCARPRRAVHR